MNSKLIEVIIKLSKKDKKNLSQKALKLTEEVGELAKAVLPYDNAYGTKHRFIKKEKILEEVADVMLCAYSIAFDLGYSMDELTDMIQDKSLSWADVQNREKLLDDNIPYELHVTVQNVNKEEFIKVCTIIGVKPIILDLQENDGNSVFEDVMSSSIHLGDNKSCYNELKRISTSFKNAGFNVVREKIETVPWHPSAPSILHKKPRMPLNCYFECHFNVIVSNDSIESLRSLSKKHNCHLSKNIYKKIDANNYKIMMTYRVYDGTRESFETTINEIELALIEVQFELDRKIVEFSIFDTKISHDSNWLIKKH